MQLGWVATLSMLHLALTEMSRGKPKGAETICQAPELQANFCPSSSEIFKKWAQKLL